MEAKENSRQLISDGPLFWSLEWSHTAALMRCTRLSESNTIAVIYGRYSRIVGLLNRQTA